MSRASTIAPDVTTQPGCPASGATEVTGPTPSTAPICVVAPSAPTMNAARRWPDSGANSVEPATATWNGSSRFGTVTADGLGWAIARQVEGLEAEYDVRIVAHWPRLVDKFRDHQPTVDE